MKKEITLSLTFSPNKFFKINLFVVLAVLFISGVSMLIAPYFAVNGVIPRWHTFNLSAEGSIPAYLSSVNLFISSALLFYISRKKKKENDKFWGRWAMLSLVFFLLSLDETVSLHEIAAFHLKQSLNLGAANIGTGIFGAVVCFGFLYYFAKFILALPNDTKFGFIIAGFVFLGGAMGFEVIGGFILNSIGKGTLYDISSIIEESMEMIGILIFIRALLKHIQKYIATETSKFVSTQNKLVA